MPAKTPRRIGYILRRFPVLSETFILNEILQMEAEGIRVEIYSLLQPRDPRYHEGLVKLKASIRYIPALDDLGSLFQYNRRAYKRFGSKYVKVLLSCLATCRPMLIWRFLQAGYIAERACDRGITHFHAHFANRAANVARIAHKLSGIPYSFTAHAVDIYKESVDKAVLAKKIADAAFVVTVSDTNKIYLEGIANGASRKITRIYNGIDLERFRPAERQSESVFTILSVARFVEKKGLDILIEACARLQAAGVEFRCLIVGKGSQRPRLVELIERHRLGGRVKLLGPHTQIEILDRYREADLFVLPCIIAPDGNRDGLPVSIVEALACGIPVVATSVAGIPEAVRDGQNGIIVPPNNIDALVQAIRNIIEDEELRARLGAAARGTVETQFDIRASTRELSRMFTRVGA